MSFPYSFPIVGSGDAPSSSSSSSSSQHPVEQRPALPGISRIQAVAHTGLQYLPSLSHGFQEFPAVDGEYYSSDLSSRPVFDQSQVDPRDFRVQAVAHTGLQYLPSLPSLPRYSRASQELEQQRLYSGLMPVYPSYSTNLLPSPYFVTAEPVYFFPTSYQLVPNSSLPQESSIDHSISSSSSSSSSSSASPAAHTSRLVKRKEEIPNTIPLIDALIALRNNSDNIVKPRISILKPLKIMSALSSLLKKMLKDQNKKNEFISLKDGELLLSLDNQLDGEVHYNFSRSASWSRKRSTQKECDTWWRQSETKAVQILIDMRGNDRIMKTIKIPALFGNAKIKELYDSDKVEFVKTVKEIADKLAVKSDGRYKKVPKSSGNIFMGLPEKYSSIEAFIQEAVDEVLNQ